jgi:hypothetical protein
VHELPAVGVCKDMGGKAVTTTPSELVERLREAAGCFFDWPNTDGTVIQNVERLKELLLETETLPARVAKLEAVAEAVRNVIPADAYDATRSFRREWVALHAALAALDVTP